ncbi:DNA helicase UvrD [Candidatus Bathyarchaeota archaeon]|nr:DNA helicase UvrD [Candidatus Bathyarchaeota archaeon]
MIVYADLHIHSKYSRATSARMNIDEIARFAPIKGLNLVGTGDFTHPQWFKELREKLTPESGTGLYKLSNKPDSKLRFMITGEVSTIFTFKGETKRIHHLILTPSLEIASQISDRLARYGDLALDGRPLLNMTAPMLVEEVMEISRENVVIPAHVWTPWFSLFGAFSGFDKIEDCYQDMTRHIFALETGLSSDPPMNWRLSVLDRYTLVSNSDSHSFWPWRMGREANVFNLEVFSYEEVVNAVRSKDPHRFLFTIETYPEYGKYHWTGHRSCHVSFSPEEARRIGNICPVCGRQLTKGVDQRVDELADRPKGFRPEGVPGYKHLLPLSEIIQTVIGVSYPGAQSVWRIYNSLIRKFGSEYAVLLEAPFSELVEVVDANITDAIIRVREERVKVIPGYDGVYGQISLHEEERKHAEEHLRRGLEGNHREQRSLADYM